jgi:hypothetical protein
MFIGREKELADLNELYVQDRFQLFVLYGACVKIGLNQDKPYK